jgi:hypothetical protein
MPLTLERAKRLQYRETLIDEHGKRWRVNGAVKTWKRDASRIRVPLKHGLYSFAALVDTDFTPDGICDYMRLEFPDS